MAFLRRFAVAAALAVAAATMPAGVALGQDRDCADFPSQEAAQAALQPGDPERLDGDDDGIACEALNGGESQPQQDRDCADFPNQEAAQAALRPGDPERLDGDGDGVACEDGTTGTTDGTATGQTGTTGGTAGTTGGDDGQAPSGGVDAGRGGTAGDTSAALLPVTLLGSAALIAGAALVVRRRSRTD